MNKQFNLEIMHVDDVVQGRPCFHRRLTLHLLSSHLLDLLGHRAGIDQAEAAMKLSVEYIDSETTKN